MKNLSARIGVFLFSVFVFFPILTVHGEQGGVQVTINHDGVYVTGEYATYLLLNIVGPDGELVCDISSNGDPIQWSSSRDHLDGQYSYEVRQGSTTKRYRDEKHAGGKTEPPNKPWVYSGSFFMENGTIILGDEGDTGVLEIIYSGLESMLAGLGSFIVAPVYADVLHYDDVIITGSECIGFDCADGESFGYATQKLKENNLRLLFDDTSTGSFSANDWQIRVNDTTSGGSSYFSIEDVTGGRTPFTIEAGAPANALYVEDYGRVGLGTSIPYVELHIVDGDSPTIRLDQDGSSGWTAQRWDMSGNETNFFIRDVTNGSKLTFRIQPNTPSNTLCLRDSGNVGIGTWSPTHTLHVKGDTLITGNLELGSSRSLKNDIRSLELTDAATTLAALNPVRFHYKTSPNDESLGFIAEDVPDLVATDSRKSISTMDVVAVLTKVVQEQQATIMKLEKSIAELAKQISPHQ